VNPDDPVGQFLPSLDRPTRRALRPGISWVRLPPRFRSWESWLTQSCSCCGHGCLPGYLPFASPIGTASVSVPTHFCNLFNTERSLQQYPTMWQPTLPQQMSPPFYPRQPQYPSSPSSSSLWHSHSIVLSLSPSSVSCSLLLVARTQPPQRSSSKQTLQLRAAAETSSPRLSA